VVSASTREKQPLLNIDEAAAYLNVPARWVADAVRLRKFAAPESASTCVSASSTWKSSSPPVSSPRPPLHTRSPALLNPDDEVDVLGSDRVCLSFLPRIQRSGSGR
jgi:hypothetical protein